MEALAMPFSSLAAPATSRLCRCPGCGRAASPSASSRSSPANPVSASLRCRSRWRPPGSIAFIAAARDVREKSMLFQCFRAAEKTMSFQYLRGVRFHLPVISMVYHSKTPHRDARHGQAALPYCLSTRPIAPRGPRPPALLRRLVGVVLHVHVDEIERGGCLFQHAPALQPVVGPLHLVERNRRRITDHETALAQVFDLQCGDLRIAFGVVVDEVVQIGALVGVD